MRGTTHMKMGGMRGTTTMIAGGILVTVTRLVIVKVRHGVDTRAGGARSILVIAARRIMTNIQSIAPRRIIPNIRSIALRRLGVNTRVEGITMHPIVTNRAGGIPNITVIQTGGIKVMPTGRRRAGGTRLRFTTSIKREKVCCQSTLLPRGTPLPRSTTTFSKHTPATDTPGTVCQRSRA